MNTLIVKLGAAGDVVRTSTLLRRLGGQVTWLTDAKNAVLLDNKEGSLRTLTWEQRHLALGPEYDLALNLEDTVEAAEFLKGLKRKRLFGAYTGAGGEMTYTDDSRGWFDMSLISRFGKSAADQLKLANRLTYQELVFTGLGYEFAGETYMLPLPAKTDLRGDVALAPKAGRVWPMKNWAYYPELQAALEHRGLKVNVLPERASLLEHLGDVKNHRVLVSGDSLPMHLALGVGVRCVTIFNCTSPWEIHPYGLQRRITSPLLAEFFFKRGMDERATRAIGLEEVLAAVTEQLEAAAGDRAAGLPASETCNNASIYDHSDKS